MALTSSSQVPIWSAISSEITWESFFSWFRMPSKLLWISRYISVEIFFFSDKSFRAWSLRHIRGIWSQRAIAWDLVVEMNVTSAPLNFICSKGCFENFPPLNSTNTASNFPLGVIENEATFPTTRPYSSFIGLPMERKRLGFWDIFFPPSPLSNSQILPSLAMLALPACLVASLGTSLLFSALQLLLLR